MLNKDSFSVYHFAWLIVFTSLIFCSSAVQADDDCVPVGSVLYPATDKQGNLSDLIKINSKKRVVLLGEHHDNMEHHRWQLQMIAGLHTLNSKLILGFEMFPRQSQGILNKWVQGELTEKQFLKEVNWGEYWSFDAQIYMPLFHFARMNKIPMIALNVDRSLIREVGKKGWDKVASELKEGISDPAPASEGYRQMLASVFMQHGQDHDEGSPEELVEKAMTMPGFSRFVESQQVWDRAMAEAITTGLDKHPQGQQIVAVLGSGHMMYHYGVPEQLVDLGIRTKFISVLIPWDPEFECDYIQKDFADAVIGLEAIRLSEQQHNDSDRPKLGVYLDSSDDGVFITDIIPNSLAEDLELRKSDLIINMAGIEINEIQQVIDIVKATQFGTWLPIGIMRGEDEIEVIAKFPAKTNATK